jgi:hypothetical protein
MQKTHVVEKAQRLRTVLSMFLVGAAIRGRKYSAY